MELETIYIFLNKDSSLASIHEEKKGRKPATTFLRHDNNGKLKRYLIAYVQYIIAVETQYIYFEEIDYKMNEMIL